MPKAQHTHLEVLTMFGRLPVKQDMRLAEAHTCEFDNVFEEPR